MKRGHLAKAARVIAWIAVCICSVAIIANADPADFDADAPSPMAFTVFPTHGLTMMPSAFSSGQLGYTLEVASGAYLLYDGTQYPITLVWAFYAVNQTGLAANNFTALGTDTGEWEWSQKPNSGTILDVGGWSNNNKHDPIQTPVSGSVLKPFTYGQMSFSGVQPSLGLHVTVLIPTGKTSPFGSGNTGLIIPSEAPEPSSLFALIVGATGLCGLAARRRNSVTRKG